MTAEERVAAEMRSPLGFACGLSLDEATAREIYGVVGREAADAGVGDDGRLAEVRRRMLATIRAM